MALEGTIKDFGLPDIFQLIGLQRKTGVLTLTSEKDTVSVTFENGMVVMADSSLKRLEDRLGSVLVKQSKLSKERLEEALQTQKATLQVLQDTSARTAESLQAACQAAGQALTPPARMAAAAKRLDAMLQAVKQVRAAACRPGLPDGAVWHRQLRPGLVGCRSPGRQRL